ncbi:MAG: hypothetical protein AAGG68_11990 [Bacteroidota bacterium]
MNIRFSLLFIFGMLCYCPIISAQKIKSESVKVQYSQLPTNPLSSEYSTYSVSLNDTEQVLQDLGMTEKSVMDSYFSLDGFKRVPRGGHFHISATVKPLKVVSSKTKTKTNQYKNKAGEVIKETTYWKEFIYYVPVGIKVKDFKGNIIFDEIQGSSDTPKTYKFTGDGKIATKTALNEAWSKDQAPIKLAKEAIGGGFWKLSKKFRDQFDIQHVKKTVYIRIPKGKKVENAEDFLRYGTQAIEALAKLKADTPIGNTAEEVAPAIDFWKSQATKFDPSNKKQVKMFYACNYNIANVSYWLDDLATAKEYAEICKTVKTDASVTRNLEKSIAQTEQLFTANNTTTRHFEVDLSNVASPEKADYGHLKAKDKKHSSSKSIEGYVITAKGDSIAGEFVISSLGDLEFYDNGNVKFIYVEDGKSVSKLIQPSWVERAAFGNRFFQTLPFKKAMTLRERPSFMELIMDGSKVQLYRYYETFLAPGEVAHKSTAIRTTDGKLIDLHITNPRFTNWKSGFSKLFEDCEVLSAAIMIGEYKRNQHDLKRAIAAYNRNECE